MRISPRVRRRAALGALAQDVEDGVQRPNLRRPLSWRRTCSMRARPFGLRA
jgi:hypothetical protein